MDPVAFTVFGAEIRWYGILMATAMVVGVFISYQRAERFGISPDRVLDFALFTLPAGIIGARIYYVLFNWDYYQEDFFRILNIREGGLALHGSLIGGILVGWILSRIWSVRPWDALDLFAPVIALGQAIGRWGNFINGEAYGSPTSLPWAIHIEGTAVHPTFLYESIWCFLLFLFLLWFSKRREFSGQIFLIYGILYSAERFFVEWLRTDSLMFFGLKTAQLVSLGVIIIFGYLYFRWRKQQ